MNFNFGVPSQRGSKKEKFPYDAVATVIALGEKKGSAKKVSFNKKACEILGLRENAQVSISFREDKVFIVNTTGVDMVEGYSITKNAPRAFSNSKVYRYISKIKDLDNSVDNNFELKIVEGADYDGRDIYELISMSREFSSSSDVSESVDTPEETPTEEASDKPNFE